MSIRSADTILLTFLFAAACSHPGQEEPRQVVDAPVVVVRRTSFPSFHTVAGTVRSQTSSTLSANVVGTVLHVLVAEGDRVREGQILVEIDAREGRAQVDRVLAGRQEADAAIEAAAANAQLAQATYRRFEILLKRGSASRQEYDEAKSGDAAARAELSRVTASRSGARAATTQAQAVLGYSSVRAPMDGIVTARFVDPGAQAAPGVALLAIEEERATRVDADVPEDIPVRAGDRAFVQVETSGSAEGRLEARVTRVQPSVDPGARAALVKLELARPLRAGSYVKVLFPIAGRTAVTIPSTALVRRGPLTSVFVVGADQVARMRLITIGAEEGAETEVLSGLDAGELIVSAPVRVRDGMTVRRGA
jgi:RND family efflux transporter MFP subunit